MISVTAYRLKRVVRWISAKWMHVFQSFLTLRHPDSGESEKNVWANLSLLKMKDEVKFVICGREDYDWAKSVIQTYAWLKNVQSCFHPCLGR